MHQEYYALMSIKPRYADMIYAGTKTVEWRKTTPAVRYPTKVFLYESSPVKMITGHFYLFGRFSIDARKPGLIPTHKMMLIDRGCITLDELRDYQGKSGKVYGIFIGKPVKYETPIKLSEIGMARPPQSWQYLSEERVAPINQE